MHPETPPDWVIQQLIHERAYFLWQNAGCPDNMSLEFWSRAEQEVWVSLLNDAVDNQDERDE